MIINFKRAYKQIKYEELVNTISIEKVSIESLYPVSLRLQYEEIKEFETIKDDFEQIGFKFEKVNDLTLNVTAVPPYIKLDKVSEIVKNLIRVSMLTDVNVKSIGKEEIAREVLLSQNVEDISINSSVEGEELINKLFACKSHQYTFDGKLILSLIETEDIEKMFE
jgi:DNA mismatch repair protein MutL